MKASELRIGNWVNAYRTTWQIDCSDFKSEYRISTYEPIPLTEEWLLKFGFFVSPKFCLAQHRLGDLLIKNGKYFYVQMEIKHVHQLQNLYHALTGEELDYE